MDLEYVRDSMQYIVELGLSQGAQFVDIRVEDIESSYIEIENGILKTGRLGRECGASIRVLYNGCWGFSTSSSLDRTNLVEALSKALSAARAMASATSCGRKVVLLSGRSDTYRDTVTVDPRGIDFEIKVHDLMELNKLMANDERVKYINIRYVDGIVRKLYVSSDGRDIAQELCYVWLYTWASAREGDIVASARDELGSRDGYTIWRRWSHEEIANKLLDRLRKQLKAKTPKGGCFPAVLAPEVVGVLVHEAFGHLAEADLTLSGSAVRDKIGHRIASSLVTIVDDPEIPGGFGTLKYDDEGVDARKAVLIEQGVVKELMVDREHAALLNQQPTGNARAESYRVTPLIRMRNTVMLPRDYDIEELFEDIEFGYYLVAFRGGQANLDGTFQVGIQEAYEIVNGRIGDPVRNLSISGNTLETLAQIDAVGKDFSIGYGRCGKGQTVFVSDGGPHVRVRKIVVGGQAL